MDKFIRPGRGLLEQLNSTPHFEETNDGIIEVKLNNPWSYNHFKYFGSQKKKKTIIVQDVGEYSIFINKNLKNPKGIFIRSKKHPKWIESDRIVCTDSGSILYFNEKVENIFKKGCIYPIIIYEDWMMKYFIKYLYGKFK